MTVDVMVEPFYEWVVDASQIKGARPNISGVTYVEDPLPYIERKLLTVNTGHSAIAYLGYARGKDTIHAALHDDEVRRTATNALEETGLVLVREYGFDPEELREYRQKVLARFENPRISDEVTRVARAHPQARPRRAVRLPGPAPPRDGPHAGASGCDHPGVTPIRLPGRRGSGKVAADDTTRRASFGPGPLRRDRGGPSARGSRRGRPRSCRGVAGVV